MEPGQISDLVKTEYGYHIISLTDKKAGTTRKLEDMKQQLADQIGNERAQVQAADMAANFEKQIRKPADLDTVAKAQGMAVQETGFFARDEPILGVGSAPEMTARAFSLSQGEVSGALRTGRGYAFETLVEKKDPYVPKLDEVKDRVRDEVIKQRALAMAKEKATELAAKLKAAPDFDKAAQAAKVEPKTTELITKDGQIPDLGAATEVIDAAFKLPKGAVSDAIATASGVAIVKVLEKQETTDGDVASNKDTFREELMADRRNRFFSAYMVKAKQKMKIQVNREAMQRVIG
jgi:peptidyl-prolyl cis-trans isomerase D